MTKIQRTTQTGPNTSAAAWGLRYPGLVMGKGGKNEVKEFTGMWRLKPDADLVAFTKTLAPGGWLNPPGESFSRMTTLLGLFRTARWFVARTQDFDGHTLFFNSQFEQSVHPGRHRTAIAFIVGDLMNLGGLPGVSQVAIQSGRHAADTIRRRLAGDRTHRPLRFRNFGTMATISRHRAVAEMGPMRLAGLPAWLMWLVVHLAALTGFKHRIAVFFNWTIGLLGGGRAERVITLQQVFGRHALSDRPTVIRPATRGG